MAIGKFSSSSNLELYEIIQKFWETKFIVNFLLWCWSEQLWIFLLKITWKLVINKKKASLDTQVIALAQNTQTKEI